MKTKSSPFLDAMDRFHGIAMSHCGSEMNMDNGTETIPQHFFKWQQGKLTHVLVHRENTLHIRYVPVESVQFFLDAYGQ